MRHIIVPMLLMMGLMVVGCADTSASLPENVRAVSTSTKIVDYSNGVYYFDCTQSVFGNKLSAFIREHPELELVSMVGDGTGGNGYDSGYFVIFREKQVAEPEPESEIEPEPEVEPARKDSI